MPARFVPLMPVQLPSLQGFVLAPLMPALPFTVMLPFTSTAPFVFAVGIRRRRIAPTRFTAVRDAAVELPTVARPSDTIQNVSSFSRTYRTEHVPCPASV